MVYRIIEPKYTSLWFDELSPIPIISIVEKTCDYIKKVGTKKVGLLGTKFTMKSDFYKRVCDKEGKE